MNPAQLPCVYDDQIGDVVKFYELNVGDLVVCEFMPMIKCQKKGKYVIYLKCTSIRILSHSGDFEPKHPEYSPPRKRIKSGLKVFQ